jgi:hypothetical protein
MIPLGSNPSPELPEEAKRIIAAGLGKAEIEFVASLTSPLFWVTRTDEGEKFKNGSAFFLDTGDRIFGVTAGPRCGGVLQGHSHENKQSQQQSRGCVGVGDGRDRRVARMSQRSYRPGRPTNLSP